MKWVGGSGYKSSLPFGEIRTCRPKSHCWSTSTVWLFKFRI